MWTVARGMPSKKATVAAAAKKKNKKPKAKKAVAVAVKAKVSPNGSGSVAPLLEDYDESGFADSAYGKPIASLAQLWSDYPPQLWYSKGGLWNRFGVRVRVVRVGLCVCMIVSVCVYVCVCVRIFVVSHLEFRFSGLLGVRHSG